MRASRTPVAIIALTAFAAVAPPLPALAQDTLPAAVRAAIDKAAAEVLDTSGAPGASVAVVRDGSIAYVRAYGLATLEPAVAAKPEMRYLRDTLGPPRVAPKEGKGWMVAAGELAMTARDLVLWDIATIDRVVLKPASYQAMQTNVLLKNGLGTPCR